MNVTRVDRQEYGGKGAVKEHGWEREYSREVSKRRGSGGLDERCETSPFSHSSHPSSWPALVSLSQCYHLLVLIQFSQYWILFLEI